MLILQAEPNFVTMKPLMKDAIEDETDATIVFVNTFPGMYFK